MGTRNLTMVLLNGKMVVAQYCQWDGYPSGQGETVVKFIQNMNKEKFVEELKKLEYVDFKGVEDIYVRHGANRMKGGGYSANMEASAKFKRNWPELHRDTGASVLELIHFGNAKKIYLEPEFVNDSLFCEWAYVVDLDNDILEVYRGFNNEPLTPEDRFYTEDDPHESYSGDRYYPVKLAWKGSFDEVDQMIPFFQKKDED